MKRITLILCAVLILNFPVLAEGIRVKAGKTSYLRYELVDLYCNFIPDAKQSFFKLGNKNDNAMSGAISGGECTARIFRDNRQIKTVGSTDQIRLNYNYKTKRWEGFWPIPWNPRLGNYRAVIIFKNGSKKYAGNVNFEIKRRIPLKMKKGFCVMDIEPGDAMIQKVPGVGGKNVKLWENYILWSKFMGADALWHCVGQSQIWNRFDARQFPWDQVALSQVDALGSECHKYDMKYGAWITSYVVLGNRKDLSPYNQTIAYDPTNNTLRQLIYVSILDEKRRTDMVELLKKMQANPSVDFLGLDYMRTDFGGLEYATRFVHDMPVRGVPRDWDSMTEEERMFWLGRKIELEKNDDFMDMWNWWRAHKMSENIADIKARAGITKPLWVFSLTWRQGKEHGQDPLMFIDAGVDLNAGMFYSIDKKTYPQLVDSWKDYLKLGNSNLVAGQCVDWNLLGRTHRPSGPEEHYLRQVKLVDEILPVNPNTGLFWHDLTRAFKGSRGPYSSLEWAVAGGATFSYLRMKQGLFPFDASWELPDNVKRGEIFTIDINIKNTGEITMDYYLKLLKVSNLEMYGDLVHKFYLAPGEIKTLTFQVRAMESNYKKDFMQMIAYMLQYNGLKTQQRYFDFKYIEVK
ncbi:MAG: hypothetical protein LLG37_03010 [Spirochaetia bacterium]|nr:hypothetical protein [Spirochaetia bacterium]